MKRIYIPAIATLAMLGFSTLASASPAKLESASSALRAVLNQDCERYDWAAYEPGKRPPEKAGASFDRDAWTGENVSDHHFNVGAYKRPPGYFSRQWQHGMKLPAAFWTRDYWIDDYAKYALNDPPYGYVWVRYNKDAVLVDVETGVIIRVVYDLFY